MVKSSKIYFLLPEPVPGYYVHQLMGRVVVDKSRPTDNYSPGISLDLNTIVPDLYEAPVTFTEAETVLQHATETNAQLAITKLVDIFRSTHDESKQLVTTAIFRRYRMTQITKKFNKLYENENYAKEILELLEQNQGDQKLGLVTGLLTCSNHKICKIDGKGSSNGLRVGVPPEAIVAAGGPPGLKIEISGSTDAQIYSAGKATGVGEMVLAISYHELHLDQTSLLGSLLSWVGKRAPLQPKPVLRKPIEGDIDGFFGNGKMNEDSTMDDSSDGCEHLSENEDEFELVLE